MSWARCLRSTGCFRTLAARPRVLPPGSTRSPIASPARSTAARAMAATTTWQGTAMTQQDFMQRDECVLVDDSDNIVGTSSKLNCHKFIPGQEKGQLHRAFSVFLFDDQGRLLLQQRASSKITFPSVWTNTCCSHQLAGQQPNEIDSPKDVAEGSVPGAKAAAVRKLEHELGIPPEQLPLSGFKYLTRLHYCAPDTHTWGPNSEWGEHEMDYILFIRANVTLKPNPEEIDAVKYVTLSELQAMMDPRTGLRFSPWFRIIATRMLPKWWANLDETLSTDKHQDFTTIHKIDPDPEQ